MAVLGVAALVAGGVAGCGTDAGGGVRCGGGLHELRGARHVP
ncbi:hypothetical protein ACFSTC_42345 [Nonomuraea ferruginea]